MTLPHSLEHLRSSVRIYSKVPSRYYTLQLKGTGFGNIYVANGDGYKEIGDGEGQISLIAANQVIMQQVQFCNYYASTEDATNANAGGKAYFNIPVEYDGIAQATSIPRHPRSTGATSRSVTSVWSATTLTA